MLRPRLFALDSPTLSECTLGGVGARKDRREPVFSCLRLRRSCLLRQIRLEEFDGLAEVDNFHVHRKVDGVEVRIALKAPAEIGSQIHPRFTLVAERTEEHESPVADLAGPAKSPRFVSSPSSRSRSD